VNRENINGVFNLVNHALLFRGINAGGTKALKKPLNSEALLCVTPCNSVVKCFWLDGCRSIIILGL
jgi:hypothetical protein